MVTKVCKQDLIYWARTGRDRFGAETYATPVALLGRWEDTNEEQVALDGTKFVCRSKVLVLADLAPGDRLALGELDSDVSANPLTFPGAYPIRSFAKIPDKKGVTIVRYAYL